MIHFLITIDEAGKIQSIKWSQPAYLLTTHTQSVLEIFQEEAHESLRKTFRESLQHEKIMHCGTPIPLVDSENKVCLCLMALEYSILLYGREINETEPTVSDSQIDVIIQKFMTVIKDYSRQTFYQKSESTRQQFEQIQTLNNDLVNAQRMLEKANAQLNVLNEELNNRLVKDALTGLVSRYQYREEIELKLDQHPGEYGIFLFIDVDNFKDVNDTHGHAVGDEYLVAFAQRLKRLPIENTVIMRIAGDEFGIFVFGLKQADIQLMEEIWRIINRRVLEDPINTSAGQLPLSISAGMAIYGIHTNNIFQLIEYADQAMYQAKRAGKNTYAVYQAVSEQKIERRGNRDEQPPSVEE